MSRCQVGDLAIVANCNQLDCKIHLGKVVRVAAPSWAYPANWECEPILRAQETGHEIHWRDTNLVPIRDQPGADETLAWAPVPQKEPA